MALLAVRYRMSRGQREKIVIDPCTRPCNSGHVMTVKTVLGEIACDMAGIGGRIVILFVAIFAFDAKRAEQQQVRRCVLVARKAIGRYMGTD